MQAQKNKLILKNMKMKKICFGLVSLVFLCIACNSKRDIQKEIKDKITEFYNVVEVENYEPISYGKFDTIISLKKRSDGSGLYIEGKLSHKFFAKSNNGNINEYDDVFLVQITDDKVIVVLQDKE
jgi:translation elongation factor EF-1beta